MLAWVIRQLIFVQVTDDCQGCQSANLSKFEVRIHSPHSLPPDRTGPAHPAPAAQPPTRLPLFRRPKCGNASILCFGKLDYSVYIIVTFCHSLLSFVRWSPFVRSTFARCFRQRYVRNFLQPLRCYDVMTIFRPHADVTELGIANADVCAESVKNSELYLRR